jgi:hypothetical protein
MAKSQTLLEATAFVVQSHATAVIQAHSSAGRSWGAGPGLGSLLYLSRIDIGE